MASQIVAVEDEPYCGRGHGIVIQEAEDLAVIEPVEEQEKPKALYQIFPKRPYQIASVGNVVGLQFSIEEPLNEVYTRFYSFDGALVLKAASPVLAEFVVAEEEIAKLEIDAEVDAMFQRVRYKIDTIDSIVQFGTHRHRASGGNSIGVDICNHYRGRSSANVQREREEEEMAVKLEFETEVSWALWRLATTRG
ncbi:hypothetical protein SUGI_0466830 [Cryptomeria japonica]|nr:hypothetical protein SUGI_0466830 [Cryptomeria japonica]